MKNMLQNITLLLAIALLATCSTPAPKSRQQRIRDAVERMLAVHPQSTLQDIYKSCFQDAFGPGHLINDTTAARRYLQSELAENDYIDTVMTEPTGIDGNYVRVNLLLVGRGEISEDVLFEALIAGANNARPLVQDEWCRRWHEIVAEISAMKLSLFNFEADSVMLELLLSDGKYVMHHSDLYGKTYHPHYRIIEKSRYDSIVATAAIEKQY